MQWTNNDSKFGWGEPTSTSEPLNTPYNSSTGRALEMDLITITPPTTFSSSTLASNLLNDIDEHLDMYKAPNLSRQDADGFMAMQIGGLSTTVGRFLDLANKCHTDPSTFPAYANTATAFVQPFKIGSGSDPKALEEIPRGTYFITSIANLNQDVQKFKSGQISGTQLINDMNKLLGPTKDNPVGFLKQLQSIEPEYTTWAGDTMYSGMLTKLIAKLTDLPPTGSGFLPQNGKDIEAIVGLVGAIYGGFYYGTQNVPTSVSSS